MSYEKGLEKNFDQKKTEYFSKLALGVLSAMRLHKYQGGLWTRESEGKREWGNVSEHCLVELARFKEFAKKLNLSLETERNGELGAALHDFDKRNETIAMKAALVQGESGREASNVADKEGERQLREAGFSDEVIELASCAGGKPQELFKMIGLLEKENLSDQEIAFLVLHYIDGYTRNSEWAEPVEEKGGVLLNDVDRRIRKNLENPNYRKQDEEYVPFFNKSPLLRGNGSIKNEGIVCHEIEKRISSIIASRTGERIEPIELPEAIDSEIKKVIEQEGV